MKKIILGSLICSVLLVAGCKSEKHHIDTLVVKAEPQVNVYDVSYNLEVSSERNKVKALITIENGKDKPIPLSTSKGQLFSVKLLKNDGTLLKEEIIEKEDRKQILRNEKVSWEVEFEANMDQEVIVETDLLLTSSEYQKFNIKNDKQQQPVFVFTNKIDSSRVSFSPEKDKVYTYLLGKDTEIKEEIMFYNDNKVQSFSEDGNVNIYAEEPDGVYYFSSHDPVGDIDGTTFIQKEDMNLLIPFPITEGKTWEIGDKKYELSDENTKVKTKLGLFDNCVEVTEINGEEKRYYYYHKDIGLLKVKLNRKILPSKTELQLAKIENPEDEKEKE